MVYDVNHQARHGAARRAKMKFTSHLIKNAWAIRRAAAARFGVSIMSVVWKECLVTAASASQRLLKAANWLDKIIAEASEQADADEEAITSAKEIATALRLTDRKDLGKGVWASIISCLKINDQFFLSSELEEAECRKEF